MFTNRIATPSCTRRTSSAKLPDLTLPPRVACDPDAVVTKSPEEGWSTEDAKRRGGSACSAARVHLRRAAVAAPPARQSRTRGDAFGRVRRPHHAGAHRARPHDRRAHARMGDDAGCCRRFPGPGHHHDHHDDSPDHDDHRGASGGSPGAGRRSDADDGTTASSHDHHHRLPPTPDHYARPRGIGPGLLVQRLDRNVRQPQPGLRHGGHRDQHGQWAVHHLHGRRPDGPEHRPGARHVGGQLRQDRRSIAGCHRGPTDLVRAPLGGARARR